MSFGPVALSQVLWDIELNITLWYLYKNERVNYCSLAPTQQYFNYIVAKTSCIDDMLAHWNNRYVAPLEQIISIPSPY
jgi:hypothetical protein